MALLGGAAVSVCVSWVLAAVVDPRQVPRRAVAYDASDGGWLIMQHQTTGGVYLEARHAAKRDWGPEQACGPPDTRTAGDQTTAWASRTQDGQPEWLLLGFDVPVAATSIRIHETYNPGAIVRIAAVAPNGSESLLWAGQNPTDAEWRELNVPLSSPVPIQKLKLYLDSPAVPGWNEIDAVGLCAADRRIHWAVTAEASSTFASGQAPNRDASSLAPDWSGLRSPRPASEARQTGRFAAAFGWPFPALCIRGPLPDSGSLATIPFPPFRPVWGGLLIDSMAYGLVLWLGFVVLTRPARLLREVVRMRRGACPRCGYDLRFDFARGCPECGLLRAK